MRLTRALAMLKLIFPLKKLNECEINFTFFVVKLVGGGCVVNGATLSSFCDIWCINIIRDTSSTSKHFMRIQNLSQNVRIFIGL